jgi:hypothetical protein
MNTHENKKHKGSEETTTTTLEPTPFPPPQHNDPDTLFAESLRIFIAAAEQWLKDKAL